MGTLDYRVSKDDCSFCDLIDNQDMGKPPAASNKPTFGPPPGPYKGSPTRGWPKAAIWMRIWWGLPVRMVTCVHT